MEIEEKITSLGLQLPEVAKPVASYIPAVQSGNLVFISGQIPFVHGKLLCRGKLGKEIDLEKGYECARIAVMNCIAALKSVIGDLDKVKRIVKITGYVNSAAGFEDQPKVLNGASDLVIEIFGEKGRHSRTAIGTNELPLAAPVEVDLIAEIQQQKEAEENEQI